MARTALFSSRPTSLMWLNWKVTSNRSESYGTFLTWACQRSEQKGLLSEYCETGLLKQKFEKTEPLFYTLQHSTFPSELCDTGHQLELRDGRFASPNYATEDPNLSELCDTGPFSQSSAT
jgi:hypothetical protein